ncbi:IucA/IucC family siderophore biosynthesis protein [Streptomyces fagopyri]|uniref:IucA/IucC family siderophore biosynthesis protein n=2 Tax=Streptomyces fagopyri TaxID=2662397 RepID=A0A5Q0LAH9_9ACTN|nr:IucA/IucC family siderophore biosynthesis protein [Streptomyces fagopyri]
MDRVDSMPPRLPPLAGSDGEGEDAADAYAAAPLLNCLLREVAEPAGDPGTFRLRASGRLMRVRGARRPTAPEVYVDGTWRRLDHTALVELTAEELRRVTGLSNSELPAEMTDSRDTVAALLAARSAATPPDDPYVRSEQSLITGHPYHPAPKTRGGGPTAGWLPYAPEAYARFPLELLGVREDAVAEEGDTTPLDVFGQAPAGYRLLPAHPWQLDLVGSRPAIRAAFADGRLVRLGRTARPLWPTAAVRTLYAAEDDLFVKFSLDVRITNDIRRLWRHDLLKLRRTDAATAAAFTAMSAPADHPADHATDRPGGASAAWLSDRGYRTADFAFEELAVLVRDGLREHTAPGTTPLLAAALVEGFEGSPLDGLGDPSAWWTAYLRHVVPPVLEAFARHGVVVEAHLQNTLVAVDAHGTPVQALFRDAEGVKLLTDVDRAAGWERLVYCLIVNNVTELAALLAERHPGWDPWPAVRAELAGHGLPGITDAITALLTAPTLPGKTNLLLRWTGADGADARYLPLANPLARA